MVVNHFLRWIDTARVAERMAAAASLARAHVGFDLSFEDRCAAEAALTLLLDDPSDKVRMAMAEALCLSHRAPFQVIAGLASDQPEIAALVLKRSPLLSDGDLVDRVASRCEEVQRHVAARPRVSMQVAAAICEVGSAAACLALLANDGADIASLSFRRMAARHGGDARVRTALFDDRRLPADCRHMLLIRLGEALKETPLVRAFIGAGRAERIMRDACLKASLTLIDGTPLEEHPALVEHLRLRGDLTASFIVRMMAHGKIDFLGAVLVTLTGHETARVRSLLASGRDVALAALLRKAGIGEDVHGALLTALKVWRDVANGRRVAGVQEVTWLMLKHLGAAPGQTGPAARHADIAGLIRSIHIDTLRENARGHALAIAAA